MKKLLIGFAILSMLLTLGYSQSITVTVPVAGVTVNKSDPLRIRWEAEGRLHEFVKIRLYDRTGTTKIIDITNSTETTRETFLCGEGFFNSVPDGDYIIRVRTTDNAYSDDSGIFHLTGGGGGETPPEGGTKSIRNVTPSGGILALDSTIRILWRPRNLTNNVTISLLKNDMVFGTIVSGLAPGRISYEWQIGHTTGRTADPDTGYKIRIDEDGPSGVFGVSSAPFEIETERNIDLSCYVATANATMITRRVRVVVKVRCRNFPGVLNDVPVKITLRKKSDGTICSTTTETIPELSYRGHSYEYTVEARLSYRNCGIGIGMSKVRRLEVVAVVDPDDIFRDRRRLNNTATKTVMH